MAFTKACEVLLKPIASTSLLLVPVLNLGQWPRLVLLRKIIATMSRHERSLVPNLKQAPYKYMYINKVWDIKPLPNFLGRQ